MDLTEDVAPGIYPDMPAEAYHLGPGLSSSGLKRLREKSPLHYKTAIDRAREREAEGLDEFAPAHLEFGRLYHHYLLEPDSFTGHYAPPFVAPGGALKTNNDLRAAIQFRGGEYKSAWNKAELLNALREVDPEAPVYEWLLAKHQRQHAGKVVVDPRDMTALEAMAAVAREHSAVRSLLRARFAFETSIFWRDAETGVLLKVRPDMMVLDREDKPVAIPDLKTARDADPEWFSKAIENYGYHISAAMYLDGVQQTYGVELGGRFLFIAQEKEPPYAVGTYVLEEEDIKQGQVLYREGVRLYAECLERDVWPGYDARWRPIGRPGWARRRELTRSVDSMIRQVHEQAEQRPTTRRTSRSTEHE